MAATSVGDPGLTPGVDFATQKKASFSVPHSCCHLQRLRRSWTALAEATTDACRNADDGRGVAETLAWIEQQQQVDFSNYVYLLQQCGNVSEGKRVHAHIVRAGHERNTFLANLVVQMYGKRGSLQDARAVFDNMLEPNVFSWTVMISAYSERQQDVEALQLFRIMDLEGVRQDRFVFSTVIRVCARLGAVRLGKEIHARVVAAGLDSNVVIGNTLVNMYGKCGCLEDARRLFEKLISRDIVTWNGLIAAYAQNGHPLQALSILQHMDLEGVKPNRITFVIFLNACSSLGTEVAPGKKIQDRIAASGLDSDVAVNGSIVNMYGKCGRVEDARIVFEQMCSRDVVSWNSMIAAYAQNGYAREALQLFRKMDLEGGKPSRVTFIILLEACSSLRAGNCSIHARIAAAGLESDIVIANSVISMHSKCGSLEDARQMFDKMQILDVVSWNTMIGAYAQNGYANEACTLFHKMDLEGIKPDKTTLASVLDACSSLEALEQGKEIHARMLSMGIKLDVVLETALVGMYSKCGSLEVARRVFEALPHQDVVLWNAMIAAYTQWGHSSEALQLHRKMELEGLQPNDATFASVLTACSIAGALSEAKAIQARILVTGASENVVMRTALINLYGKTGNLVDARCVFDGVSQKDVVCWTAMVVAYAQQGDGKEALEVFRQMEQQGMLPNEITFINILFACSHAGLLDEGCHYFVSMTKDHSIVPVVDHYLCMVDLLGRVGKLSEAEQLIDSMPFQPDYVAWMTFLGACRTQGDAKRAEDAARRVLKLASKQDEAAAHVLLRNIMTAEHSER